MSVSPARNSVQEIAIVPERTSQTLKQIFNLTINQYVVLGYCERDDKMKYGYDPRHVTAAQKPILEYLIDRSLVWYSTATGKYELTGVGRGVLLFAGCTIDAMRQNHSLCHHADVLTFPSRVNTA